MTDEKAREVAIALSQNLISFHKGRRALARTPIKALYHVFSKQPMRQSLGFVPGGQIRPIRNSTCEMEITWHRNKRYDGKFYFMNKGRCTDLPLIYHFAINFVKNS
jgi:hypothetical protein